MVKTRSEIGNISAIGDMASPAIKHKVDAAPLPYPLAMEEMTRLVEQVQAGGAETLWFLEHPPSLTAGTSAKDQDLLAPDRFDVFQTGRGGQYTYHGPGQRIAYTIINLRNRGDDVRRYVATLEQVIIDTLDSFAIKGERREDRVGVWVKRPEKAPLPDGTMREDKIAALGIRVSKGVAFHGLSINVEPDLSHFDAIVPCGVQGHGTTSLVDLGLPVTMDDLDIELLKAFRHHFGEIEDA